ncbi:MFS transporter [Erythrobacter sp. YT30]|uniref:MFS transporter n=1 Tax=Erythrobacter sp. YT30 TaxID=1735012 RepID=UPI001F277786|nr:MFS transporter [Erythrobacter sp. YT30]
MPFNIIGLLFDPLQSEFGWTRLQVSAGVTVFGITAALLAPLYGAASDRFGVRPVTLISVFLFGLSFAAFFVMPGSLVGYYSLWFMVGLVGIGSTPVTWSRAINLWFFRNRGLALGIMLLGTSLAAIVVPKLAGAVLQDQGWRYMFLYMAGLPLLVSLPLAVLFFREPRDAERPREVAEQGGNTTGIDFATAIKDRRFWLIFASIMLIATAYGGAHIHMIPIVMDHGFGIDGATTVMSSVGLGIFAGRIITGALLDRFWAGHVAFPLLSLPAIACVMLAGQDGTLTALVIAGFMLGFAAGAESDLIAYLTGRYFGMGHYGKIYGMLYLPFGLFSATSPMIYGGVRDATGSYDLILFVAAPLFILGGALLLFLGRYPESFPSVEPTSPPTPEMEPA